MDKKAIKTFAIESRKKLIEEVKYQASLLGITTEGIADPVEKTEGMEVYDIGASTPNTIYDVEIKQRNNLVRRIKEKGFDNVVEEVAYTWFNRIIAIRFMEVNDYLPSRIRVLSSKTEGKLEPDIVTDSPNVDLGLSDEEIEQIYHLKNDNRLDALFQLLFIKQCNKLNEILPELFEKTADYTELLLSISFTNEDGIVSQLIDNISEQDFTDQVEIIGWLYQYYNTELKDATFKQLKKRVKISKERIPAATQLFTPDWIVRYMVENSLGRLWLEGHPKSKLEENWSYYLDEADQEPEVQIELTKITDDFKKLKPEDIKVIDPAMGSGHILVYAFDVLMQIYSSVGYSKRDAAKSILKNNLYGLDIDDRAYQLAYFAVMMKGRSYNPKILTKNIEPNLCSIQESNEISDELIDFVADGDFEVKKDLKYLKSIFKNAKEFGSIVDIKPFNYSNIIKKLLNINKTSYSNLESILYQDKAYDQIKNLLKQSNILKIKYDVVITNPPYMGNSGMNRNLVDYLKVKYPNTKSDLSTVFMEKTLDLCKETGYVSMINIPVWMFIVSYQKLREFLINSKTFVNMLHFGRGVFGSDFGTTAFVIKNRHINDYLATYRKLYNKLGAVDTLEQKKSWFFEHRQDKFIINQKCFSKIPGYPIAYWVSLDLIKNFENGIFIEQMCDFTGSQNITANNKKYLRMHWEIEKDKIDSKDWVLYAKGGDYRKYYGNLEIVVDWTKDAREFYKNNSTSNLLDEYYWYKEGITYTAVSSKGTGFRYLPKGCVFDKGGPSLVNVKNLTYCLGFLNSKISEIYLQIMNPTLNIQVKDVKSLPVILDNKFKETIEELTQINVDISKNEWNNKENSIDFKKHPFFSCKRSNIKETFNEWEKICKKAFLQFKTNEEKINKIFIEIYNLKEELNPEINDSEVTINRANLEKEVKSYISYSVGCILGRYSLDEEGIIFAGGQWDPSKYSKFLPDDDNIVPILDNEYFEDDIVGRFVEFVKVTFGEETLEENLDFIASALKKKGSTSREVIRNYFLTDFYNDHLKTYKKHPIYWQFDSGRNNGFKTLIYIHRYEPDLLARVRTDYLHKTQKALETAIANNERIIENSITSDKSKAIKAKDKLIKQLEETRKYDFALAHVANLKIAIDLDDGVKVNHAKFQGVKVSSEGKKSANINLLKKI